MSTQTLSTSRASTSVMSRNASVRTSSLPSPSPSPSPAPSSPHLMPSSPGIRSPSPSILPSPPAPVASLPRTPSPSPVIQSSDHTTSVTFFHSPTKFSQKVSTQRVREDVADLIVSEGPTPFLEFQSTHLTAAPPGWMEVTESAAFQENLKVVTDITLQEEDQYVSAAALLTILSRKLLGECARYRRGASY